jgi:hypothetical protein
MKKHCQNDCLDPLILPKQITNRPGLDKIKYRIGEYADFREALFRGLDQEINLQGLTHRMADDPAIALLEGASTLGDILTFYQELYANEAYLRTAKWRESVADLVRLIGYRLSPGLGGVGTFAFDVRGEKSIDITRGFPIKAQLKDQKDQINFESVEKVTAYPWLSKFHLYRPLHTPIITLNTQEFYISIPDQYENPISLKKGDRLFIGDPIPIHQPTRIKNGEIIIIDSERTLHGRKIFKIKGTLKRTSSAFGVVGCKIGRSFHHFGYNAPIKNVVISSKGFATTIEVVKKRNTAAKTKYQYTNPSLESNKFPFAQKVEDLANGSLVIIESRQQTSKISGKPISLKTFHHPRIVKNTEHKNMKWGSLESISTFVTLNQSIEEDPFKDAKLDQILFYEVIGPVMVLHAAVKENQKSKGDKLYFHGTNKELKTFKKRRLAILKPNGFSFEANVIDRQKSSSKYADRTLLRWIKLDRKINYAEFSNEKPVTWVYGNLVDATQGKTEKETVLGNGDHRQKFQTFKIPKKPLTYFNTDNATPPEIPELKIYVNDLLWKRVASFYNHKAKEQIYVVREDGDQNSWVQFGDGKTGSLLPSGINNVKALYRSGTGAYGPIKEDTKAQAGGKLERLDKIYLPGLVSGGTDPENMDNARTAAPGKIQSLNRLVSIKDFETETLSLAGVSKALATWDLIDQVPGIILTVLMKSGRDKEINGIRKIISNYNRCRGPQRFPIKVNQGNIKYVFLDLICGINPRYQKKLIKKMIKRALGILGEENDEPKGLLCVESRTFSQNEYATRVAGILQNIEGINWVKVKAFGSLGEAEEPKNLVLPNEPKPNNPKVSCSSIQVLKLLDAHLNINLVIAQKEEDC